MKLGLFIVTAIGLSTAATTNTHADASLVERAAVKSRARDHAGAVELYRKAYEAESDPALLVRMGHEYRLAGDAREALAYFCSYMYVDAAGELADEASTNARAIAGSLGNPTQSDHDACSTRPPASRGGTVKTSVSLLAEIDAPPPRITKREITGLALLGGTVATLGLALYEARKLMTIREDMAVNSSGAELAALQDRESSASLRQKLFLGVGGAALLTGGLLYVTGRNDRKRAERAYVAPSLAKGSGGLVVGRRF